jgi:hypothetical protein
MELIKQEAAVQELVKMAKTDFWCLEILILVVEKVETACKTISEQVVNSTMVEVEVVHQMLWVVTPVLNQQLQKEGRAEVVMVQGQ